MKMRFVVGFFVMGTLSAFGCVADSPSVPAGDAMGADAADSLGDVAVSGMVYAYDEIAIPAPPTSTSPAGEAGVYGMVLTEDGMPLAGFKVTACSESVCVYADSQADGTYFHPAVLPVTQKIGILGKGQRVQMIWHQPTVVGEVAIAARPVRIPKVPTDMAALDAAAGGTVSLAGGSLDITVAAGTLEFPVAEGPNIGAVPLTAAQLPPLSAAPWERAPDETLAWVFHPFGAKIAGSAQVAINAADLTPGDVYDLWTAEKDSAVLEAAGTATVAADGRLLSDAGSSVHQLTILIAIPAE